MVRDIPQYEEENVDVKKKNAGTSTDHAGTGTAHVGTAAIGRPASAASVPAAEAITTHAAIAPPTGLDLPAVAASEPKPVHPDPEFWENWEAGGVELKRQEAARRAASASNTPVGTAAIGCPAALPEAKESVVPTPTLPKHDFTPQPPPSATSTASKPEAPPAPPRKPAASAPAAPKERKNPAQRASAG